VEARIKIATQEAKTNKEAQSKAVQELAKWVRDPDAPRFRDPALQFKK